MLPGSNFETAAYAAQSVYPDVGFSVDRRVPHDESGAYATASVMVSMVFAEEEADLAGYAAVKEGYTKLGILGDRRYLLSPLWLWIRREPRQLRLKRKRRWR